MRIRPLAVAALLAAVALLGTACKDAANPQSASSSPAVPPPTDVALTGDPAADLAAALERSAKQPAATIAVTLPNGAATVQVDHPGELLSLVMTTADPATGPFAMEMIVSGTDMYTKYVSGPLAESAKAKMQGKEWVKQQLTTATGKTPAQGGFDPYGISNVLASEDLLPADAKVTRDGLVYTVEGSGVGKPGSILSKLGGRKGSGDGEPGAVAITVGRDGLVIGLATVDAEPGAQTSMSFRYEPVDIRVPDPDTVLG